MAKDQSKRLTSNVLQADRESFAALQAIDGYAPANTAYAMTTIAKAQADLTKLQTAEVQAAAAAAAVRDDTVAKEWEVHNMMLGAKDQVIAQFGKDSNEVQSIGLKKKSEYKSRQRKAPTGNTQQ